MKKILIILTILVMAAGVNAQIPDRLTLQQAIALALNNNSDLVNARLDRLKAEYRISEEYANALLPNITLNTRYNRSFKKQTFDIFGEKIEVGTDNSITNTIDVMQNIPGLGNPVMRGMDILEHYERLSIENIRSTETRIKTDVKKAYYNVLFAKEVVALNEFRLRNASNSLQVVDARYRNGAATEFEYLRSQVNVNTIQPALEKSQADYELALQFLQNTLGIDNDRIVEVTGNLEFDSVEVYTTTDRILTQIAENNVIVRQLEINRLINRELVEVEKASYLPRLYLFGQYSLGANENDDRSLTDYRFNNTLNAGLGLSWNLNFFPIGDRVKQAEIEVLKSDEQIENVKRSLKIQAESIITRMEDARRRVIAQHETVLLAERGLQLANASFAAGVIRQIDVLDAELAVSQSRFAYLQAIYDYLVAKSELEGLLER